MSNTGFKCVSEKHGPEGEVMGFFVRVQWKGNVEASYFPVADYPSENAALDAAITFRDQAEHRLGKPRSERRITSVGKGVFRATDGYGNQSWCAQVQIEPGRQLRRHFAIKTYGDAGAKKLALSWRRKRALRYYRPAGA